MTRNIAAPATSNRSRAQQPDEPLLDVHGLTVSFGGAAVVSGLDLAIRAGECVAIVGESGSGKSVTARSLLGLAGDGASVTATGMRFRGAELTGLTETQWRRIRGAGIGLILQDALVSLDPLRSIGQEIDDALRIGTSLSRSERAAAVIDLLERVGMPDPAGRVRSRSGELSGGLRQRALIAAAIALDPPLVIADEPTTALDVTVQARILDLLATLRDRGTGLLLISHDLAVVSAIADRVVVMRNGAVVETGTVRDVLQHPRHEYTRALIAAVPTDRPRGSRLVVESSPEDEPTTATAPGRTEPRQAAPHRATPRQSVSPASPEPILDVRHVSKSFARRGERTRLVAVSDASVTVGAGTTLGVVGESGSGKTTLARMVLGLTSPDEGGIVFDGLDWTGMHERERRAHRRRIGAVYQDSLSSFDPRWRVGDILRDALSVAPREGRASVEELLDAVALHSDVQSARPRTLSGGQRQRVAIARALAPRPELLVLDEPVSALDVTVQARVLDLLDELQADRGLTYLFVSHDLGVVRHMSDRVIVMRHGRIVEAGDAEAVFTDPSDPYTAALAADAPRLIVR
ncbi:dipeptide ABC transporter ATP-binding protein [Plantibacter sp. Mn2098]|uniref:dipeptide ABC transporter ATP-binding protein n=1 Tax=Plantibacter sp. Mn2098 TaxID=3395266 RepID=UPI003BC2220A